MEVKDGDREAALGGQPPGGLRRHSPGRGHGAGRPPARRRSEGNACLAGQRREELAAGRGTGPQTLGWPTALQRAGLPPVQETLDASFPAS